MCIKRLSKTCDNWQQRFEILAKLVNFSKYFCQDLYDYFTGSTVVSKWSCISIFIVSIWKNRCQVGEKIPKFDELLFTSSKDSNVFRCLETIFMEVSLLGGFLNETSDEVYVD